MKTLRIVGLALMLMGARLFAQTSDLPQVFSPNAEELGKYGKIPVSYFNGLPNITIPLTELKAKDYTLPIYLSYHAGGNKPDQHPGWVGLGWALHAGGCINRIVNGLKDEMSSMEYYGVSGDGIGYYYHADLVNAANGADSALQTIVSERAITDYSPDEFMIDVDGIHASFFFVGTNDIRIVSKDCPNFTVQVDLDTESYNYPGIEIVGGYVAPAIYRSYNANRYTYFKRFIITDEKGVQYEFGGDDTAIEYSSIVRSFATQESFNQHWAATATANTWYLKKISFPNGEQIEFEYEKDGTPMVLLDRHHGRYFHPTDPELQSTLGYYDESTFRGDKNNTNYNIVFLQPSYLKRIHSQKTDNEILFSRQRTMELTYEMTEPQFKLGVGDFSVDNETQGYFTYERFLANDYYMRLSDIWNSESPEEHIQLSHSNTTTRRLRLEIVKFKKGYQTEYQYLFEYNPTPLPSYNSKQTDYWGYYNGVSFKTNNALSLYQIDSKRSCTDEEKTKAEILTRIYYPTGGYSDFEYELHDYRKIARQFPFFVEDRHFDAEVGGLRIHAITDNPIEGNPVTRLFEYKNGTASSGILSGTPKNYDGNDDCLMESYTFSPTGRIVHNGSYHAAFKIYSEDAINELSTTEGCHVTYSKVTERYSDGSAFVYEYSNHDTPFGLDRFPAFYDKNYQIAVFADKGNSHALFRGLLLRKAVIDRQGETRLVENNSYQMDTSSFVNSIGWTHYFNQTLYCVFYRKLYCTNPYLHTRTITTYPDTGTPHVETFEYTYDDHRRLTESRHTVAGVTDRETFTYTGNYDTQPYLAMKTRNMVSLPVEHLTFHKSSPSSVEKLVEAELTTWKQDGLSHYEPNEVFHASLGSGVTSSSFCTFNGTSRDFRYGNADLAFKKYDSHTNPVWAKDREGISYGYIWDASGVNPVLKATNAANEREVSTWYQDEDQSDLLWFTPETASSTTLSFASESNQTVRLRLGGALLQNWIVYVSIDNQSAVLIQRRWSSGPMDTNWRLHRDAYTFQAQVNIPAGNHTLRITSFYYQKENENDTSPCGLTVEYRKRIQHSSSSGYDSLFYEDFESSTGAERTGYNSSKAYKGVYYVGLPFIDPGRTYVLDYREKGSDGVWRYRRLSYTGGTVAIGGSSALVDDIRIFPTDATVESFTWDDKGNLLSRTDGRGITESYTYDGYGRLSGVYDNNGNKVEGYEYNFRNR